MRRLILSGLAFAALGGAAAAQPPAKDALVSVSIGQQLQSRAKDFGQGEFQELTDDLRDAVATAMAHARGNRPVHADLVIEDAVPNRPTTEQLGRTPGLSIRSVGLGGARVSGTVVYADGSQRPLKEQFYETDLQDVHGFGAWYDADRAFEQVAYDIAHNRLRDAYLGPGPSGNGHFGYPLTNP